MTTIGTDRLRLFNADHNNNYETFVEDTSEDYIQEENIKIILTDYSNCLTTTSIPKFFDGDLQSNSNPKINAITLKNYLREAILMLKDNFTKKCAWEQHKWITSMNRDYFDNKCKCDQGKGNVDASKDTKHGIYSKA